MILLPSFFQQQSQQRAVLEGLVAPGLEDQLLQTNPHSSPGGQVLVARCLRREELRTWISSLEMRHWLQPVDLVWKKPHKKSGF